MKSFIISRQGAPWICRNEFFDQMKYYPEECSIVISVLLPDTIVALIQIALLCSFLGQMLQNHN